MLPEKIRNELSTLIAKTEHPKTLVVDVMFALQDYYGYLNDEALETTATLLDMTPLEVEELATFYTFIYREPVGRYVIHLCDSVVCWVQGHESIQAYLCRKLQIDMGETTADGLFTLLPVCCIGYCDRSPAMLVNRKVYGPLTLKKIDEILLKLKQAGDRFAGSVSKS